jgi:hypothetical protein
MHKAVAKEGPRAPLFYLGVVVLLAIIDIAAAQAVEQSDLELCARQETAELKLACFEVLTNVESKHAGPTADVAPEPPPESDAAEKALITTGAAVGVAASDVESVAPAPAPTAEEELADVGDKARADATVVDRAVAEEMRVDELGREHLDEKNVGKEDADVRVTVREVVKGSYDVLYFHFTNGQIWRQTESRRFNYPRKGEFEVVVSRGMMGDYRLRVAGNSPMTPIRRLQ